jgi:hypothetical protein
LNAIAQSFPLWIAAEMIGRCDRLNQRPSGTTVAKINPQNQIGAAVEPVTSTSASSMPRLQASGQEYPSPPSAGQSPTAEEKIA